MDRVLEAFGKKAKVRSHLPVLELPAFHFCDTLKGNGTLINTCYVGALQGGTCVILGDDYKLMGETAKIAKQKLGCQVFRRPPYFRKAGHVQVEYNKEPLAKRCAYTVQYLQEIEMMTHADYFVGAHHTPCS